MVLLILIITFVVFALWHVQKFFQKPKNFPPGPSLIPVRALVKLLLSRNILATFHEIMQGWIGQYGTIIGFGFGSVRFIFLNESQIIQDGFIHPNFQERPKGLTVVDKPRDPNFTYSKDYKPLRNFLMKFLCAYRRGKQDKQIHVCISSLSQELEMNPGQPVKILGLFQPLALGVVWHLLTGRQSTSETFDIEKIYNDFFRVLLRSVLVKSLSWVPILNLLPSVAWLMTEKQRQGLSLLDIFNQVINEAEGTLGVQTPKDPRSLIDAFLLDTQYGSSCLNEERRRQLLTILSEIFIGAGTLDKVLAWGVLYMTKYPNEQTKLQVEIDNVIGTRLPETADIERMPVMKAFIAEGLRRSFGQGPFPLRVATAPTHFQGFFIPEGTYIHLNTQESHLNSKTWGDPEKFRPERFLSEDGSTFINRDEIIAFGAGGRVCPGEQIARSIAFLTLATILQKYRVVLDIASEGVSVDERSSNDKVSPMDFSVLITTR